MYKHVLTENYINIIDDFKPVPMFINIESADSW